MDEMMEILKNLDWSPLFISIKTGIVATIFSFFLGIYAARKVVKTTPGKKAIIDGILTLPMVLPPTVAGFFLLLIFSRRRPFGIFLFENFGIKVVQTWLGCIIAATVISFPLMYRNARAAMEQIDVNLIYAGRTLGMSDTEIFWKVVIPTAGPGIASGTILTFARALGEYGATSMLAGNIPGKTQTMNFYNINDAFYFVDLPGYGYAAVRQDFKAQWGPMIEKYLRGSGKLKAIFLLVDIRHEPSQNDCIMYDWIINAGFKPILVATKADKLKKSQIPAALLTISNKLRVTEDTMIIPFSALKKDGRDEIMKKIDDILKQ